jgi:hypothetical protein
MAEAYKKSLPAAAAVGVTEIVGEVVAAVVTVGDVTVVVTGGVVDGTVVVSPPQEVIKATRETRTVIIKKVFFIAFYLVVNLPVFVTLYQL